MQEAPPRVPILVSPVHATTLQGMRLTISLDSHTPGHQFGRIHLVEDTFHPSQWDAEKDGR